MKQLAEIVCKAGLEFSGLTINRTAVRAIILDRDRLFMVYSAITGDYKFPGGGIEPGENHATALIREVREETGVKEIRILGEVGEVIEYDTPLEPEYDLFKMISYYYLCEAGDQIGEQQLDQYEADLEFVARWVPVDKALEINSCLLQDKHRQLPRWTRRETEVLSYIERALIR